MELIKPAVEHSRFTLKNGKALTYAILGAKDASHLAVYAHGFPGSRIEALAFARLPFPGNFKLIAIDRPGIGGSDFDKDHSVASWGYVVREFLASQTFERLTFVGASGGAPYALSAAAALPDSEFNVFLTCSMGPIDAPGVMTRMLKQNAWLLKRASTRAWLIKPVIRSIAKTWQLSPGTSLQYLKSILKKCDREILETPEVFDLLKQNIQQAFQGGINGPVHQFFQLAKPWGLNLSRINGPVTLWHGLADRYVPPEMSQYLASALPNSTLRLLEGEGHFFPFKLAPEILEEIIKAAKS